MKRLPILIFVGFFLTLSGCSVFDESGDSYDICNSNSEGYDYCECNPNLCKNAGPDNPAEKAVEPSVENGEAGRLQKEQLQN